MKVFLGNRSLFYERCLETPWFSKDPMKRIRVSPRPCAPETKGVGGFSLGFTKAREGSELIPACFSCVVGGDLLEDPPSLSVQENVWDNRSQSDTKDTSCGLSSFLPGTSHTSMKTQNMGCGPTVGNFMRAPQEKPTSGSTICCQP